MGISCRVFLVDQNDRIFRLPVTKFAQMLEEPAEHRFPSLSGQRIRAAEALVELIGREPTRVIRITFDILTFNDDGCLDSRKFSDQQFAHAELAIEPVISHANHKEKVVAAASKFIAQGGRWIPSKTLAHIIYETALGKICCPRASSMG
jgi:hypothetical protein